MDLDITPGRYAVCRFTPSEPLPPWAEPLRDGRLYSSTITRAEASVVCPEDRVPADAQAERDWVLLSVRGPLDFSLVGILAALLAPLKDAGVSVFAMSTYDTDYLLVKHEELENAVRALEAACHKVYVYKQ